MSVVHIEHGIRGKESLLDMEFVRQLSEIYEIPFSAYAYPVRTIAKEQGLSIEEAGRNVRKQAYAKEAAHYGGRTKVALAHHADDNAETLLFHLCRGSGIEGISGIYPVRGNLIRPLLCVSRQEIEAYLEKEGQAYRVDTTNADIHYSRNRIRNRILPEFVQINEKTVAHINCLTEDAREISEYLSKEAKKVFKEHRILAEDGSIRFPAHCLSFYPPVLQKRVLLELLTELSGSKKDITREHVCALLDLARGQTGRRLSLPYGMIAENVYGDLICYAAAKKQREGFVFEKKIVMEFPAELEVFGGRIFCRKFPKNEKDVKIPKNLCTKWFDYDKIKNMLCFRFRETGDFLVIDSEGHKKKLKDYFIGEKVPRKQRDNVLLLADGSHILWVVGGRMSEYYKVTRQTRQILEVHFMEARK